MLIKLISQKIPLKLDLKLWVLGRIAKNMVSYQMIFGTLWKTPNQKVNNLFYGSISKINNHTKIIKKSFLLISAILIAYIQAQSISRLAHTQTGTTRRSELLMHFSEHLNGWPNIASFLCIMAIFHPKLVLTFDWLSGLLNLNYWHIQK